MELEEIKSAWLALGEKLDKKEKISDLLIREMYRTKVKKSLNIMLGYEIFGVVICLICVPLLVWLIMTSNDSLYYIALSYWMVFTIVAALWSLKKTLLLMKLDEIGKVKNNVRIINTYTVWINKEKPFYYLSFVVGVIPVFIIYWYHAQVWAWAFLLVMLVLLVFMTIWIYKRLYDRNIQAIQRNLDELRDLDEKGEE